MRETPSVIPDRIEPVVAYRYWLIANDLLQSYGWSDCRWECYSPLIATHIMSRFFPQDKITLGVHNISDCKADMFLCGIYGIKTYNSIGNPYKDSIAIACGQVYLWGLIVEHELGYRAEYAYPKCLYLDGEKDDTIRMIASNYRIPAVEPPAMEPQPHFNSLFDIQRDTYNAFSRYTGVQG